MDSPIRAGNHGFVNQPGELVDRAGGRAEEGGETGTEREEANAEAKNKEWIGAEEASALLGVKRETLYAYASRGWVRSTAGAAGGRGVRARAYHVGDLERLKARSRARAGHTAVAAGALRWGEPVLETSIGAIREEGPVYRGRPALELAREGATFEDVCALLWGGAERRAPLEVVRPPRGLGARVAPLRALLPGPRATPFDAVLVTAAALAAAEPYAEPSIERARANAPVLVRRLVAACGLVVSADAVSASLGVDRSARALLVALGGRATSAGVAAIDEALVLAADHELNPSTFAARVASSSGASLPSCIVAALATLSGPRHGGATARVEAFAAEVARPERAAAAISARLERGESIPGFGHPLYPRGDPRGRRLLELAERLGPRARGVRLHRAIVDAMALVTDHAPTVDIGLCALTSALGLGPGAPLAIFACGRLAGWIAHAIEQREAGFVLRPRARYVGD